MFQAPYAKGIDALLPVENYAQQDMLGGKTLPLSLSALLQPGFVKSFENNPAGGARVDTARNDLLQGWAAKAPLLLCGGSKDPEVEYKNALLADAYFKNAGSPVNIVDVDPFMGGVPQNQYHVTVAFFCITIAKQQVFDPLKNQARP